MTTQITATEVRIPVPWGFIAAKSWGNSDGYPIIAVHGTMDNAASFDNLAPLLPRKFFILAVDLPGHGKSSHYPDGLPYHFMDMVLAVKRVVNYFKWETCYFVGHSFGGMIGSIFAAMYPDIVKKLVMLDIVKQRTPPSHFHPILIRNNYELLFEIERKTRGKQPPTDTKDALLKRLKSSRVVDIGTDSAKDLLSRSIKNISGQENGYCFATDQKVKASIHIPLSVVELCGLLASIRCELLIVRASESKGLFELEGAPEVLAVFRKCCPKFENVTVEGRHEVHMDNPELVAPIVSKFLSGNSSL